MGDRISAEGRLAEEIAMDHRARLAQRRTAVLEADPGKILAEKLVAVGGQTFVAGRASRAAVEAQHHMITGRAIGDLGRSEEHTSELQSLMRISYAVF